MGCASKLSEHDTDLYDPLVINAEHTDLDDTCYEDAQKFTLWALGNAKMTRRFIYVYAPGEQDELEELREEYHHVLFEESSHIHQRLAWH
jgi:hypothetical protein